MIAKFPEGQVAEIEQGHLGAGRACPRNSDLDQLLGSALVAAQGGVEYPGDSPREHT